jgi:hypothetical protein
MNLLNELENRLLVVAATVTRAPPEQQQGV